MSWKTDKMKLYNFTFLIFKKYEQNATKVGYQRQKRIKTSTTMAICLFYIESVFRKRDYPQKRVKRQSKILNF